jgi:geranylgeranyl diphosphate synthase type II
MNEDYLRYKTLVETHLLDFLPEVDSKSMTIVEAMRYSLSAGGKRIRPALLLGACEFCGGDVRQALPYACAIEYVHTYSLIHDDLPAMDDDDLRRGLPTNHKVYGEAMAILAGDGLLTSAFEAMYRDLFLYFDDPDSMKRRIRASYEIAKGAGCRGMVAGQAADIEGEGKHYSKEMLDYIHINKTGALIVAAIRAGAHLGNADEDTMTKLTDYAENLGLAFQILDDILDVVGEEAEMGKSKGIDIKKQKSTYPALYGLEQSYERMHQLTERALEIIAPYYDNAEFFSKLVRELENRTK